MCVRDPSRKACCMRLQGLMTLLASSAKWARIHCSKHSCRGSVEALLVAWSWRIRSRFGSLHAGATRWWHSMLRTCRRRNCMASARQMRCTGVGARREACVPIIPACGSACRSNSVHGGIEWQEGEKEFPGSPGSARQGCPVRRRSCRVRSASPLRAAGVSARWGGRWGAVCLLRSCWLEASLLLWGWGR